MKRKSFRENESSTKKPKAFPKVLPSDMWKSILEQMIMDFGQNPNGKETWIILDYLQALMKCAQVSKAWQEMVQKILCETTWYGPEEEKLSILAGQLGFVNVLHYLCRRDGSEEFRRSALIGAMEFGNTRVVQDILKQGISDNWIEDPRIDETFLRNVERKEVSIIKSILEAKLIGKNDLKFHFKVVCEDGNTELAQIMIDHGIVPCAENNKALKSAAKHKQEEMVALLLRQKQVTLEGWGHFAKPEKRFIKTILSQIQ